MRGSYLHNDVLIDPLVEAFRSFGATTRLESYVNDGTVVGAVDLLVEQPHVRIAIEAELSSKRIGADLRKVKCTQFSRPSFLQIEFPQDIQIYGHNKTLDPPLQIRTSLS